MAKLINGNVLSTLKTTGEIPGTTGELKPAVMSLTTGKGVIVLDQTEACPALRQAASELFIKVRTNVSGRRTYTAADFAQQLVDARLVYAFYLSNKTILETLMNLQKVKAKDAVDMYCAYEYAGSASGINDLINFPKTGTYLFAADFNWREAYDKLAELEDILELMPLAESHQKYLRDLFWKNLILETNSEGEVFSYMQVVPYATILEASNKAAWFSLVDQFKALVLSISADRAQLQADLLACNVPSLKKMATLTMGDAFVKKPEVVRCLSNATFGVTNSTGTIVTDFAYNHIYANAEVYVHGGTSLLDMAGITFDDTDTGNGNAFPNHVVTDTNALFGIATFRTIGWSDNGSTFYGCLINGSLNCYVGISQANITDTLANLMYIESLGFRSMLPTVSVNDPAGVSLDHLGLIYVDSVQGVEKYPIDYVRSVQNSNIRESLDLHLVSNKRYNRSSERKYDKGSKK